MDKHESQIQQALEALRNQEFPSIRAAARGYNVPESTLRTRLKGVQNRRTTHEYRKRLSVRQQEFLVEWILEQEAQGFPPSHARARDMATRILRMNGDSQELGKKWIHKFIQDNPRIASVVGKPIEAARINGTNPEAIQEFYTRLQDLVHQYNIQPCNMWNMDEHGIGIGICTNSQVLASSTKRRSYVKSPESREWVSIIETVSPLGGFTRPLIIFKGQTLQTSHFPCDTPDWLFTNSENGWTTNEKCLNWLQTIFIPETQPLNQAWRLLIMDGHGSHVHVEFLWICKKHKIQLLFLPAHTSHVLQPLDLGVFAPLKSRYRGEIAKLASLDDASDVKKQRFIICYKMARLDTFTPRLLRTGWKAAGIYPLNPSKGLNSSQVQATKRLNTPPPQQALTPLFATPKSSRQIHEKSKSIRKQSGQNQALFRVLTKAGEAIDLLNTSTVALETQNAQLKARLQVLTTKKRKKVPINPNTQFANIDSIIIAKRACAIQEAQEAARQPLFDAEQASNALQEKSFEELQFEWQL